jgi:ribonuclease E
MMLLAVAAVIVAMLAFVPGPAMAQDDVDIEDVYVSGDEVCVVFEVDEDDDEDDDEDVDDEDDDDEDDDEDEETECEAIDYEDTE